MLESVESAALGGAWANGRLRLLDAVAEDSGGVSVLSAHLFNASPEDGSGEGAKGPGHACRLSVFAFKEEAGSLALAGLRELDSESRPEYAALSREGAALLTLAAHRPRLVADSFKPPPETGEPEGSWRGRMEAMRRRCFSRGAGG